MIALLAARGLEALPGSTVLDGWIERGVRIYHQAFEVSDIEGTLRAVQAIGAKTTMVLVFNAQGRLTKRITYADGSQPAEEILNL